MERSYRFIFSLPCAAVLLLVLLLGPTQLFAAWRLADNITEATLDNGMKILVVERHDTPLAFCNLYYGVGSVRERPGITGISHLLEHMMFKGTKVLGVSDFAKDDAMNREIDAIAAKLYHEKFWSRQPDPEKIKAWEKQIAAFMAEEKQYIVKNEYWQTALAHGATFVNASTGEDLTGYYLTLPAHKIELQMLMEADRMQNSQFREFYSEKEVVREERRMYENFPDFFFEEQLYAAFFEASPYSWHVLGWDCDLQRITRRDVMEHYKTYYAPNNAIAIYVGDLDPDYVIAMARRYFGPIPRGKDIEPLRTREPRQMCRKRAWQGEQARDRVRFLFHAPNLAHDDVAPLMVAAEILSGENGRLNKMLRDTQGLAVSAESYMEPRFYEGIFHVTADLDPASGKTVADLEAAMHKEINSFASQPPAEQDVTGARNRLLASFLLDLRQPWEISEPLARHYFAAGDWRHLQDYLDHLDKVTPADVLRVAGTYLVPTNRTTGVQEKTASPATAQPAEIKEAADV